jgi:hypothetical protein
VWNDELVEAWADHRHVLNIITPAREAGESKAYKCICNILSTLSCPIDFNAGLIVK